MRILIASNSYPTKKNPTRQVFVKNIVEGLKDKGHEIGLLYNIYFRFFKSDLETGTVITKFIKIFCLLICYAPYLVFKCRKYDIVYSHAPLLPGLLMVFASKLHNIKHITYAHGSVNINGRRKGLGYKLSKYTMQNCDLVFTNSKYMKYRLIQDYEVESEVVTPGYNSKRFYNYHGKKRPVDILFAGSCISRKGIYPLLEAINNNSEFYRKENLVVNICCSGVEKPKVVDFWKNNHLQDIITLREKLTQDELVQAYNKSKMVVLPSIEEPLGLVGIEAIACGAFLIASDTGGIPEYLKHGKSGLLCEPGNSAALQQAIETAFDQKLWLLNNHYKKETEELLNDYSLKRSIEETILHFQKLLQS